jgi:hypothetical protein
VALEALANPRAAVAEAADRADLVAAPAVLDHAFGDVVDIDGIVVEVADEGPDGFHRMVEDGAVVGRHHARL